MCMLPASHASGDSEGAFEEIDVPPELQPSVARHRANLSRLVGNLRMAGVGDHQIEASVNAVVASYQTELLSAIRSLVKHAADA